MESGAKCNNKMVATRRNNQVNQQQRQVRGKKNVLKSGRQPLRQINSTLPYSFTGGKKPRQEDKKPPQEDRKPLEKVKSQVDVGCQAFIATDEDLRMCTENPPPPKYWELLSEKRGAIIAEVLAENRELHQKVEKLTEATKDMEKLQSDVKFFAMMYNISSSDT